LRPSTTPLDTPRRTPMKTRQFGQARSVTLQRLSQAEEARKRRLFIFVQIQRNLGLTNLNGPKILFFLSGVLLLQGLFTIKLTTDGLIIHFFIAGILLFKGSLNRGFSVICFIEIICPAFFLYYLVGPECVRNFPFPKACSFYSTSLL
jgi:hypothetical protein